MDTSLLINFFALGASILALALSSLIGLRQAKYMRDASHVDVALEYFREFRTPKFLESMDYVRTHMPAGPEDYGLLHLPDQAKEHALKVGYFFQSLGFLVKFGITDADMWINCMGRQITTAWEAISPYAKAERKRGVLGVASLHFFEDLAARCTDSSHEDRLRALNLRTYPTAVPHARQAGDGTELDTGDRSEPA
jgi:hypothetical protein